MELQEIKTDFQTQLQQEQVKLQEITQKIWKLYGAIEAVDLITQNIESPIIDEELPPVTKSRKPKVIDQDFS